VLAHTYMSAADLQLTEPQREALIATLDLFESGEVRHVREDEYEDWEFIGDGEEASFTGLFNMRVWGADDAPYTCGTVACIGGTAELIGKVEFDGWNVHKGLSHLFGPSESVVGDWDDITVERAAKALRCFLITGTADWSVEPVFVP
jgi:hypothetical protein